MWPCIHPPAETVSYYHQKYGTVMWGLNKLYLLMEKQHNRGQDGAGIATVKLDVEPGYPFMNVCVATHRKPLPIFFSR
jgi:amidophosphoribosyltransferase